MRQPKKYVLINRGFSGTYLEDHIGHEMINFLADDRGRQWCFINKNGELPFDKYDRIDWVINVILVRRGVFEVLNAFRVGKHLEVATKTSQGKRYRLPEEHAKFLRSQKITYGGVPFHDIFEEEDSVVTFSVAKVYLPRKRIILTDADLTGDPLEKDAIRVKMIRGSDGEDKKLGNQSPRTYVSSSDGSYEELLSLFQDESMFKKGYLPQYEDILLGVQMAYCERDSQVVDITEFEEQKRLFLKRIKANQRPKESRS